MSGKLWYVRIGGRMKGPCDLPALKSLVERGQLQRFHKVSEDQQNWVLATTIPELFSGRAPRTAEAVLDAEVLLSDATAGIQPEEAIQNKPRLQTADPKFASTAEGWFYADAQRQHQGPLSRDALLSLWQTGIIEPSTLVWKEGQAGWLPLSAPELALLPFVPCPPAKGIAKGLLLVLCLGLVLLLAAGAGLAWLWNRGDPLLLRAKDQDTRFHEAVGMAISGWKVLKSNGAEYELPFKYGTCFAVSPQGHLLTSRQVVHEALTTRKAELLEKVRKEQHLKIDPSVWVLLNKKKYLVDLNSVHVSDNYDFCILKIDHAGPYFGLADQKEIPRGKALTACGFPENARRGLVSPEEVVAITQKPKLVRADDKFQSSDLEYAVKDVTVGRPITQARGTVLFQLNPALPPGYLGGPLLTDGIVLGINIQGAKEEDMSTALAVRQLREEIAKHVPGAVWK